MVECRGTEVGRGLLCLMLSHECKLSLSALEMWVGSFVHIDCWTYRKKKAIKQLHGSVGWSEAVVEHGT